MSVLITSAVFEHSKSLFGDLLTLLAIAYYADDNGKAWPSVKTIAERIHLSERQVQYSIAALVKAGELSVEHRQGPKGCNLFTVIVKPASGVQSTSPQVQSTSGCNGVQGEVHFANGVHPTAPSPRPFPSSPPLIPPITPTPPLSTTVREPSVISLDDPFISELKKKFSGVNVEEQFRKISQWKLIPKNSKRLVTKRFLVNWFMKADTEVDISNGTKPKRFSNLTKEQKEDIGIYE
jgi:hypothetical protein